MLARTGECAPLSLAKAPPVNAHHKHSRSEGYGSATAPPGKRQRARCRCARLLATGGSNVEATEPGIGIPTSDDYRLKDMLYSVALAEAAYKMVDDGAEAAVQHVDQILRGLSPGTVQPLRVQCSVETVPHRYMVAESEDTLYVAFVGTKQLQDLLTDLNYWQQPLGRHDGEQRGGSNAEGKERPSDASLLVHQGFMARASRIPIAQLYNHAVRAQKRIVFCGHSLGGAVAALCALRLLSTEAAAASRVSAITFACVALGNADVSRLVTQNGWSHLFLNFILPEDDVVRLALLAQLKGLAVITQELAAQAMAWPEAAAGAAASDADASGHHEHWRSSIDFLNKLSIDDLSNHFNWQNFGEQPNDTASSPPEHKGEAVAAAPAPAASLSPGDANALEVAELQPSKPALVLHSGHLSTPLPEALAGGPSPSGRGRKREDSLPSTAWTSPSRSASLASRFQPLSLKRLRSPRARSVSVASEDSVRASSELAAVRADSGTISAEDVAELQRALEAARAQRTASASEPPSPSSERSPGAVHAHPLADSPSNSPQASPTAPLLRSQSAREVPLRSLLGSVSDAVSSAAATLTSSVAKGISSFNKQYNLVPSYHPFGFQLYMNPEGVSVGLHPGQPRGGAAASTTTSSAIAGGDLPAQVGDDLQHEVADIVDRGVLHRGGGPFRVRSLLPDRRKVFWTHRMFNYRHRLVYLLSSMGLLDAPALSPLAATASDATSAPEAAVPAGGPTLARLDCGLMPSPAVRSAVLDVLPVRLSERGSGEAAAPDVSQARLRISGSGLEQLMSVEVAAAASTSQRSFEGRSGTLRQGVDSGEQTWEDSVSLPAATAAGTAPAAPLAVELRSDFASVRIDAAVRHRQCAVLGSDADAATAVMRALQEPRKPRAQTGAGKPVALAAASAQQRTWLSTLRPRRMLRAWRARPGLDATASWPPPPTVLCGGVRYLDLCWDPTALRSSDTAAAARLQLFRRAVEVQVPSLELSGRRRWEGPGLGLGWVSALGGQLQQLRHLVLTPFDNARGLAALITSRLPLLSQRVDVMLQVSAGTLRRLSPMSRPLPLPRPASIASSVNSHAPRSSSVVAPQVAPALPMSSASMLLRRAWRRARGNVDVDAAAADIVKARSSNTLLAVPRRRLQSLLRAGGRYSLYSMAARLTPKRVLTLPFGRLETRPVRSEPLGEDDPARFLSAHPPASRSPELLLDVCIIAEDLREWQAGASCSAAVMKRRKAVREMLRVALDRGSQVVAVVCIPGDESKQPWHFVSELQAMKAAYGVEDIGMPVVPFRGGALGYVSAAPRTLLHNTVVSMLGTTSVPADASLRKVSKL